MVLAEFDLKIRGPGQVYGLQQHGYADMKIADFSDTNLIQNSKKAVNYFLTHYTIDGWPKIEERTKAFQIEQISRD